MTVREYHNKYLDDIRNRIPLTLEELFAQIKLDYEVTEQHEIEYGRAVWKDGGEVVSLAKGLLENRVSDKEKHIRIAKEYEARNRILYRLFPEAHHRFLDKWEAEKFQETFRSPEYKAWAQRVESGEAILSKQERDQKKKSIFGEDVADEIS